MNSFKRVRAFQIESEFGSVGFWGEGKTGVPGEKTFRSKRENQQQTQPTYGVDAGIWTRATLVGGERSHHCATLAPWKRSKPFRSAVDHRFPLLFYSPLSSVSRGHKEAGAVERGALMSYRRGHFWGYMSLPVGGVNLEETRPLRALFNIW